MIPNGLISLDKQMTEKHKTQQEFLLDAMVELKLSREAFAERIGCPWTTFKKWMASPEAVSNYRDMPTTAWSLVREVMAHERLKKEHVKLQKKAAKCP